MNKNQYRKKYQLNPNISKSELEMRWKRYQEEKEMMDLMEAARNFQAAVAEASSGGGGNPTPERIVYPFPTWNKSPYTTEDANQFVLALETNLIQPGEPTISVLTAGLATAGWNGGVVAPNGMIYFAPGSATQIAKLDPTNDSFSLIGPVFSGATSKYQGGNLAPNGYIYFMPNRNGNVLKLDPNTDTVTQISAAYGNAAANGSILSPQGNIYTVPQTKDFIIKLDTSTDTLSTIPRPSVNVTANLWSGAVLAGDGKIYMIPTSCNAVLELDPATDEITTHVVYDTALRNQYLGAVLGPDGFIYGVPNESFQVMKFDPVSKTAQFISSGGYAFGGALGPNGTIYMTGFVTNNLPTIDTLDNSVESYTVTGRPLYNGGYFYGGGAIMALSGNVYITGNNTSGIFAKVTFPGTNTIDPNWVLSRQSNKF